MNRTLAHGVALAMVVKRHCQSSRGSLASPTGRPWRRPIYVLNVSGFPYHVLLHGSGKGPSR